MDDLASRLGRVSHFGNCQHHRSGYCVGRGDSSFPGRSMVFLEGEPCAGMFVFALGPGAPV